MKVCNEKVKCWVEVPADHWIALEHNAQGYDLYVTVSYTHLTLPTILRV